MDNKKSYIFLIMVLAVYLVIILILKQTGILDKKVSYILFSDQTILRIEKNKYYIEKDFNVLKNKKFETYDYDKYIGIYNVKFDQKSYRVYDDKYNLIKFENNFIGIYDSKNKIQMNTNKIESLNEEDKLELNRLLSENNINSCSQFTKLQKKKINNGEKQKLYIYDISCDNLIDDDVFSIIYTSDKEEYNIIKINNVKKDNYYDSNSYYIEAILDFNNDNKDEIIIDTMISSQNGNPEREMFKFEKNKYIKTIIEKSK